MEQLPRSSHLLQIILCLWPFIAFSKNYNKMSNTVHSSCARLEGAEEIHLSRQKSLIPAKHSSSNHLLQEFCECDHC